MMNVAINTIKATMGDKRFSLSSPGAIALVAVSLLAMTLLETADFFVASAGAICYLLQKAKRQKAITRKDVLCEGDVSARKSGYKPSADESSAAWKQGRQSPKLCSDAQRRSSVTNSPPKMEFRQPSAVPIKPVSFRTASWDAQLKELLSQMEPTPESRELVHRVERIVEQAISISFPQAKVVGFASVNPLGVKAFGVAVPEVDIVVNVPMEVLRRKMACDRLDTKQHLKAALRTCTEALVTGSGLKFRRSAFQTDEPKVILLAPASLGVAEYAFGINVSVNALTPSRSAALFEECAQLEPRAKDLILLVRRWARDRAISHSAKGTFPPYVWTILAIYFLQVGVPEEGPLLPPMTVQDGVLKKRKRIAPQPHDSEKSAASLFKEFFRFFASEFDWSQERVSISEGVRGYARHRDSMPLILDPFNVDARPAACLTRAGLSRVREELDRAQTLCSSPAEGTLAELLVPWAPPEAEPSADAEHEDTEEGLHTQRLQAWRGGGAKRDGSFSDTPIVSAAKVGLLTGASVTQLRPGGRH